MRSSENIDQINTALSIAQGEFAPIEKTRINKFFTSKYADLSDILVACIPVLSKNGLALCQGISIDQGRVVITTRLVHKSGQWFESDLSMRPEKDTPQSIGSAATYGRRYAAEGMLGVSATHDDDGNESTGNGAIKTGSTTAKIGIEKKMIPMTYSGDEQEKQVLRRHFSTFNITNPAIQNEIHNKSLGKHWDVIVKMCEEYKS